MSSSRSSLEAIPPRPIDRAALSAETRRLTLAWIVALVVVIGGTILWIALVRPPNANWIWGQIFGLAALPGKYLIFSGLIAGAPLGPWHIALLATVVDIATALTIAVSLGWIGRFDWIARNLRRMHDSAHGALQQFPRIRRMAFWGVVLFVFLPLPASGAIGGTFVGQFLGLTRTAGVAAVTLGGALVSVLFALLATFVGTRAKEMLDNPWVSGVSIAVFALFAWIAWIRARALLQKSS